MGFIGLGAMGSRMAAVLQAAGVRLVVCDTSSAATRAAEALGATVAASPADVAATPGAFQRDKRVLLCRVVRPVCPVSLAPNRATTLLL